MHRSGIKIHFSDFFHVSHNTIEDYGALDISLINDMPLFIDPFLLFRSSKPEYHELHQEILRYLRYLRDFTRNNPNIDKWTLQSLFHFPEIKENWLGFCLTGNAGSGLGTTFAQALSANLGRIFSDFGNERITKSSHLEKLCIIAEGVGRDYISDFTTNLIFKFLLTYTETFAQKYIAKDFLRSFNVRHVYFDYNFGCWQSESFILPCHEGKYVILTPRDILTRDDTWINQTDMVRDIEKIAEALPDGQLRSDLNRYLSDVLRDDVNKKEQGKLVFRFYQRHPELVDHYIRNKEDHEKEAEKRSAEYVTESEEIFIFNAQQLSSLLKEKGFYSTGGNSIDEARKRILFLKDVIENQDGYKLFFQNGKPLTRENDLQIMYRLTWFGTEYDVNREVNNGRGPVDFKISQGAADKNLVEMKLASNNKLRQNLEHQVEVYKKANETPNALKVILCQSDSEIARTKRILSELGLSEDTGVFIIDATPNKVSASNVKTAEEE